jgi:caffeoyl-CoA O-methyltransferase
MYRAAVGGIKTRPDFGWDNIAAPSLRPAALPFPSPPFLAIIVTELHKKFEKISAAAITTGGTMSAMIPDLEGYFRGLVPQTDALLQELEAEAQRESIPIVGPLVGELLFVLASATGAKNILELGTASGYSAIFLGRAGAGLNGRVISLELDEAMAQRARGNLARAGLSEVVEVRVGEALKLMAAMSETFDLIFLDIDKESYLPALSHCRRLLRAGGLLVADNVGFAGAADFNQEILDNPAWRAVHLLSFLPRHSPEHDGLTLAVKEARSGRLW